jgi:hypothetical protein
MGIPFFSIVFSGASHYGPEKEGFVARSLDSQAISEGNNPGHLWYASSLDNDKGTESLIIPQTQYMRRIILMLSTQPQVLRVL